MRPTQLHLRIALGAQRSSWALARPARGPGLVRSQRPAQPAHGPGLTQSALIVCFLQVVHLLTRGLLHGPRVALPL